MTCLSLDIHKMQLPREIIVGSKSLLLLSEICVKLGYNKSALVITGQETFNIAGKDVVKLLEREGLEVYCHIVSSKKSTEV